ncbi:hypothetical protein, partial [Priestia megaterium]|uniref:hypothetical protein n=1 Tax=Priestia megaterium TaxID=1404 RepID=UPI00196B830B
QPVDLPNQQPHHHIGQGCNHHPRRHAGTVQGPQATALAPQGNVRHRGYAGGQQELGRSVHLGCRHALGAIG